MGNANGRDRLAPTGTERCKSGVVKRISGSEARATRGRKRPRFPMWSNGERPVLYFHRVDLRLLKLAGVIDVQGLPFSEDIENLSSRFPVSVAGSFCSTEWEVNF